MSVLSWDKPKKIRATEQHNAMHSSDSGIDGTYVPNMSDKDRLKWKAKLVKGSDPRVEIRKTVSGKDPSLKYPCSAQALLVVRPDGSVVMSANSRLVLDTKTWEQLGGAVAEARLHMLAAGLHHCRTCGTTGSCLDCLKIERSLKK